MMVAHMHQVEITFHYNLQRVLREYLVKEWEGRGKKYYITPVTGEPPFEKVPLTWSARTSTRTCPRTTPLRL
jgi:hypothetical protein